MIQSLVKEVSSIVHLQINMQRMVVEIEGHEFGTNPYEIEVSVIYLIVIRENDTEETLLEKVRLVTILGTFQSTLTNFNISQVHGKRTVKKIILGFLTGIMDCQLTNGKNKNLDELLLKLKNETIKTNKKYQNY